MKTKGSLHGRGYLKGERFYVGLIVFILTLILKLV